MSSENTKNGKVSKIKNHSLITNHRQCFVIMQKMWHSIAITEINICDNLYKVKRRSIWNRIEICSTLSIHWIQIWFLELFNHYHYGLNVLLYIFCTFVSIPALIGLPLCLKVKLKLLEGHTMFCGCANSKYAYSHNVCLTFHIFEADLLKETKDIYLNLSITKNFRHFVSIPSMLNENLALHEYEKKKCWTIFQQWFFDLYSTWVLLLQKIKSPWQ
jgi:hypothetical protein